MPYLSDYVDRTDMLIIWASLALLAIVFFYAANEL